MVKQEHKSFRNADEVRSFSNGKLELVSMAGAVIGRLTLEPGWRWSKDVKPYAGTEWCEAPHFQYQVSGTLHVVFCDGTEMTTRAGDVTYLPAGHDAWVVGMEPVVLVDWFGAAGYAKSE